MAGFYVVWGVFLQSQRLSSPASGASAPRVRWSDGMDSSRFLLRHHSAMLESMVGWSKPKQEESGMNATTVVVDLAKNVFQLVVADGAGKAVESHRLSRTQFERWFMNRKVDRASWRPAGVRTTGVAGLRPRASRPSSCRPPMCVPTCGATRPTPPMPGRCWMPRARRISCRYA